MSYYGIPPVHEFPLPQEIENIPLHALLSYVEQTYDMASERSQYSGGGMLHHRRDIMATLAKCALRASREVSRLEKENSQIKVHLALVMNSTTIEESRQHIKKLLEGIADYDI